MENPEITTVKSVNGCEVKFVNRGYKSNSFFITNCGDTTTVSRVSPHGDGEIPNPIFYRDSTSISKEIELLEAERTRSEIWEKKMSPYTKK